MPRLSGICIGFERCVCRVPTDKLYSLVNQKKTRTAARAVESDSPVVFADDYLVLKFARLFLDDYLRTAVIIVVMFLDNRCVLRHHRNRRYADYVAVVQEH